MGATLSPKGPKLRNMTWAHASHGLHVGSIWIDLGPTSAQHDQVAPTWEQVGPHIAQFGPKLEPMVAIWARWQVGANLSEFGARKAQVGSCLVRLMPRTAKFGFLSVLFTGCGRCSSRSDPNITKWKCSISILTCQRVVLACNSTEYQEVHKWQPNLR